MDAQRHADTQKTISLPATVVPTAAVGPDLRLVRTAAGAESHFKVTLSPAPGQRVLDYPELLDDVSRALDQSAPVTRELWDGEMRYLVHLAPYLSLEALPGGVVITLEEHLHTRPYGEQLPVRDTTQDFLARLGEELKAAEDPLDIQEVITRGLGQKLGANRVSYFEVRDGHYHVDRDYTDGAMSIVGCYPASSFSSQLMAKYNGGRVAVCADVAQDSTLSPEEKGAFEAAQIGAYIGVPLLKGGRLAMGLAVHMRKPREWRKEEITLVEETAGYAWAAVEMARAKKASRKSEDRLHRMMNVDGVGILTFDYGGGLLTANDAFLKMVGYTRPEFASRSFTWRDFTPPDHEYASVRQMELVTKHGTAPPYEKEYLHKDGSRVWMMFVAAALDDDTLVEYAIDISARKRAEEAHHASEAKYRMLFDSIDVGFCTIEVLFDEQGAPNDYRFLEVNPAFLKQTGLVDPVGRTVREFHDDHEQFWYDIYGKVAQTGEPVRLEHKAAAFERFFDVYAFRVGEPGQNRVAVLFTDIAKRKMAEAALNESEERFRHFVTAGSDILYRMSPDWKEMRALDGKGLLTDQSKASPSWIGEYIPDSDRPAALAAIEEAIRTRSNFELEHRVIRADGTIGWVSSRAIPVMNARGEIVEWFGAASDVTERREAEEALRETQEEFRLVLENARDYAIVSLDLQRQIKSWNTGAQIILGFSPDEVLGQPVDIIFTQEDRAAGLPEAVFQEALHHGRAAHERWLLRKDGSSFWASGVMMTMHDSEGSAIGFVKIFQDNTEQMQAKEELERSLRETKRAREDAEAAGRAKDQFLATLSHELRTPLTPIRMISSALSMRDDLPEDLAEDISTIERNVVIEAALIDDLLDVTRISRGKMELVLAPVNFRPVLEQAVQVTRPEMRGRNQSFAVDIAPGEYQLNGNATRLQQVLWNLLKNASKFTPVGGSISLAAQQEGGEVVITVRDNGIGFDEESVGSLFDPFVQASRRITQEYGGLGLGLSICKAIVEAHHGTISASSAGRDQGASFVIRLPLLLQGS